MHNRGNQTTETVLIAVVDADIKNHKIAHSHTVLPIEVFLMARLTHLNRDVHLRYHLRCPGQL